MRIIYLLDSSRDMSVSEIKRDNRSKLFVSINQPPFLVIKASEETKT